MKKRFLVAAVAATLVSPLAAQADATVYGNVHLSIDSVDESITVPGANDELTMNNRTSSLGVKGKEDLGGGMTALFKVEFGVNPDTTDSTISSRDQWVGLKGAMGTVKFGTMSSNYKQMGGKIDPMYRTALEGRGHKVNDGVGGEAVIGGGQSKLHSGSGIDRGRSTDTLQYTSPKMGGMSMVFNTTFEGVDDETMGLGLRYKTKAILAYFDYIDMAAGATTESAMKVGGSFKMGELTLGLQYEDTADLLGADYTFVSANYDLSNANVALTVGSASEDVAGSGADDGSSLALMYNHHLSKRTNAYVGYGTSDVKSAGTADVTDVTFGLRHKF